MPCYLEGMKAISASEVRSRDIGTVLNWTEWITRCTTVWR